MVTMASVGAARTDVNAVTTDTLMKTPSRDLMVTAFPGTRIDGKLGQFETPLSIEKARAGRSAIRRDTTGARDLKPLMMK